MPLSSLTYFVSTLQDTKETEDSVKDSITENLTEENGNTGQAETTNEKSEEEESQVAVANEKNEEEEPSLWSQQTSCLMRAHCHTSTTQTET